MVGEAPGPGLTTGRVQGAALGGRHPEVGGARVKDDFEGLRRGADADLTVVLGLQGEGERWPEGLGGPWGLPDMLFGTWGEMRQTMQPLCASIFSRDGVGGLAVSHDLPGSGRLSKTGGQIKHTAGEAGRCPTPHGNPDASLSPCHPNTCTWGPRAWIPEFQT